MSTTRQQAGFARSHKASAGWLLIKSKPGGAEMNKDKLNSAIRELREQASYYDLRIKKLRGQEAFQVIGLPGEQRTLTLEQAQDAVYVYTRMKQAGELRENYSRLIAESPDAVSVEAYSDLQAKVVLTDLIKMTETMFPVSDEMLRKIDRIIAILNENEGDE